MLRMARTARPLEVRFWEKVKRGPGCWPWQGTISAGRYGVLGRVGGGNIYAHRLSYELTNGPIPDGLQVMHTCDNPPCVNPAHLMVGSQRDNVADMCAKGRGRYRAHRGEQNGRAVLNATAAREIRDYHATGDWTIADLARLYSVGETTIRSIVQGRRWRVVSTVS